MNHLLILIGLLVIGATFVAVAMTPSLSNVAIPINFKESLERTAKKIW